MATILETGLIEFLMPAIVFLFVLVTGYALLMKVKFFGSNKGLNGLIAFIIALLFFIVPQMRTVVTLFTPWVSLLTILVVALFVFFMFLGVKEEKVVKVTMESAVFMTIVIAAILILFLIALTQAFGPFLITNQEPGFWNAVKRVVFSPMVLGAFFIIILGSYAVKFIAEYEK